MPGPRAPWPRHRITLIRRVLRLGIGPAHRPLMTVTALLGAAMLIATDLIARTVASPAEVPLGVITAALGAPFMLWLLMRRRRAFLA